VNVIFLVTGQVFFKMGTKDKTFASVSDVIKMISSPAVLAGLLMYAFATGLWLYILSKLPLNRAYPIQALAYPAVMVLSRFLFDEPVSITRWVGVGVILIGIAIVVQP
jgi:drug/metabolite transporter (DMT)-like permease